jgi:fructose-bisphosphate aldolase class 1
VVTEGLDGLRERLQEYAKLGAQFAKWRAVINISEDNPSSTAIEANCHVLARYAALCQEAGIVPMVEPEVIMDGDHSIEVSYEVHEAVLRSLFNALYEQNVMLEGTILKSAWSFRARIPTSRSTSRKWPKLPCACSRPPCRPRCRASCSSPVVRPTSSPRRTSTR